MKQLMLGNAAVARGLYEAGCCVISSYPGTPSTEITEEAAKFDDIYCEWAPNEKVAMEVAFGASLAGKRSFCAMKHVGLNVAADPLFTVAYTGVNAGMVIAVAGLYLLCMKNGFGGIETSDWILLSCAVLFSFQIMTVDHFAPQVDGVRLSLLQFFVVAVESTAAALLFENPTLAEFGANWLPLAYCGVMSSGVAYTLQILGQRDVNPAIASLIMCLESVFSALGGWLLLHQSLSMREVFGCTLIFAAVVLAQLPVEDWLKCRSASRK